LGSAYQPDNVILAGKTEAACAKLKL